MAERPKTQTSSSVSHATPDATAPISSAVAVELDVHVPAAANVGRGFIVERNGGAFRVRTILVDGDTCTTVDVGKNQAYHKCINTIVKTLLTTRARSR